MIKTQNLICGYPNKTVLRFGTFDLSRIHFVLGPNGSGKTTVLKTLAGLLKPLAGQTISTGKPIYLPAHLEIQQGVTGYDLEDVFEIRGSKWNSPALTQLLQVENLLSIPLEKLSSGEAQRILLSALLRHHSNIVVLDEPLSHLDWNHSFVLAQILREHAEKGRVFVSSSHDLNWCLQFPEAQALAFAKNEVVESGPLETVLISPKVQRAFNFRSQLTDNPLNTQRLLALAAYDEHR